MLKSATLLNTLDQIIHLSPVQKRIAKRFYFWQICIQKQTMKGLWMRLSTIAKASNCSIDTVIRFLKQNPNLVRKIRRSRMTNSYFNQKEFIDAMKLLDQCKMLNKNLRQQKNWLMGLMKGEMNSHRENVGICDPICSNLRPNPYLYPKIQVQEPCAVKQKIEVSLNPMIDSLPIALEKKLRLQSYPEVLIVEAYNDYKWYSQRRKIQNPYGLFLNRIKDHESRRRLL